MNFIVEGAGSSTRFPPADSFSANDFKYFTVDNFASSNSKFKSFYSSNDFLFTTIRSNNFSGINNNNNNNNNNINNINLYTIHDCFATDYKNMAILEILIKKCFSDLYFNNNYFFYCFFIIYCTYVAFIALLLELVLL